MNLKPSAIEQGIPKDLHPHFQEYDIATLNLMEDANLIIQRTLEFGTWEETRWLFSTYGAQRIRAFLRRYGERTLNPVVFNYWRKLMRIRSWRRSPFPIPKGDLWQQ
jgi:hypothetical protein